VIGQTLILRQVRDKFILSSFLFTNDKGRLAPLTCHTVHLCVLHILILSSDTNAGPVLDISHGVFRSRLKTILFLNSFLHSHLSLAQAHVLECDHSVFGSH